MTLILTLTTDTYVDDWDGMTYTTQDVEAKIQYPDGTIEELKHFYSFDDTVTQADMESAIVTDLTNKGYDSTLLSPVQWQ